MAIVHSYARFSDPSQAAGDSLRRQQEAAERWCEKHGHQLSDLRFHDLGKSGWRGNKQKALEAFLKAVDDGRVKSGEILLVEAVDRLSRKGVRPTQTLVNRILNAGVSIAILSPVEKVYRADDQNDIGGAIELAAFAFQASTYSENLSRRVNEANESHRRKFRAGERARWSPVSPAWLEWDSAKNKWRTKPDVVKAIKYIFKRTIEGVGQKVLTSELNAKFPPPGGRKSSHCWNGNYIARLLKTRMVVGELCTTKGEKLVDYYPAIISESDWRAANVSNAARTKQKGPSEQHINIFTGILFNALDRSKMGYYNTSRSVRRKDGRRIIHRRYQSMAAKNNAVGAGRSSVEIGHFEELVFGFLPTIELSSKKSEASTLEGERQYIQQEIDAIQEQIKSRSGSAVTLAPVLADLAEQLASVEKKIRETSVVATAPTVAYRKKLAAMRRGTQSERERVRDAVRAIVRRIEVLLIKLGPKRHDRVKCLVEVEFRSGEFVRGLELPDGGLVLLRGPAITQRLSEQVASGWTFTASEYQQALKLLTK